MDYWYSEQLRNYRLQFIRAFSNFYVKTGSGGINGTEELIRVPCRYGDPTRIAATIVRGNSENKILSVPFITCYISNFSMAPERRQDPQLVQSAQVIERKYDNESQQYTGEIGNRYTIDRYMPVPYNLTMQVDIWTNNLSIKEQLVEQLLVLYNPSIDIQTSVNPIDWTVLTYIEMENPITWTSRSIPVGTENPIDIFTMQFKVPIWINPPAKVKKQSLIQQIVTNIVEGDVDTLTNEIWTENEFLARNIETPGNCCIRVKQIAGYDYSLELCGENGSPLDPELNPTVTTSKVSPTLSIGMSFVWNGITCIINHTTYPEAVQDIKNALVGTKLNCILFNTDTFQFVNTTGGDNTFSNIAAGSVEALGLVETTYPGGNYAWWRLLHLYGNVKSYSSYGTNASQIRLKTTKDIEEFNTDIIGWIDFNPLNQNLLTWHIEPESLPVLTLPAIDAIIDPTVSGPGINLPVPIIGQRYLLISKPANTSQAWGDIDANENDIIEFTGTQWLVSWSETMTDNIPQYVKNNRSAKIFKFQNGYWSELIEEKYLPGYWRIAL